MNAEKTDVYAQRISRVCDYVDHNLDLQFDLEKISQIACFSKYHFHRQFSEYMGITIFKYIVLMRLKRASYKLAFEKELKVIDIALDAQFESHETFSRSFKSSFNQTPTQFRKQPDWRKWHSLMDFPSHKKDVDMKITIVHFEETKTAYLEHRDSPELVYDTVSHFIEWRKETGLSPVQSSDTYGIIFDDPENTPPKEFRFDICSSVKTNVPSNSHGVKTGTIPSGRCAVIRHHGSYDAIGDPVRSLYRDWLPSSGEELRDFPCFFHYLNLIHEVEEHELKTDIYLPLK